MHKTIDSNDQQDISDEIAVGFLRLYSDVNDQIRKIEDEDDLILGIQEIDGIFSLILEAYHIPRNNDIRGWLIIIGKNIGKILLRHLHTQLRPMV